MVTEFEQIVLSADRSVRVVAYALRDTIRSTLPPHHERVDPVSRSVTYRNVNSGTPFCALHVSRRGIRLYVATDGLRAPAGIELQGSGAASFVHVSTIDEAKATATKRLLRRVGNLRRA